MTLTPLYEAWLSQLRQQEHVAVLLVGVAVLAVLAVALATPQQRRWLLPLAGLAFGSIFFVVLVYGILRSESTWRLPTCGLLLDAPLWYDEAFTYAVARLDWPQMIAAIGGDVHPPLWYVVEWLRIRVAGGSEVALRVPALTCGVLGLWLLYQLALALGYERRTALWGVVLLAAFPAWRYYSQEARMYTLLACAVLLMALGLATEHRWLAALGAVIALYTHNLGAFYVAAAAGLEVARVAVWAVSVEIWRWMCGDTYQADQLQLRRYLVTILAWWGGVLLAWLPWLLTGLLPQVRDVSTGFWVPGYGLGGYLLALLEIFRGAPEILHVHGIWAAVGLLALAGWYAWREPGRGTVPMVLAVVPALLLAVVSELFFPTFLYRALLPSLPFLALLAAAALERLAANHRRVILAALVPVLVLAGLWQVKEGMGGDRVADALAHHLQEGDTIYHANLASYILTAYYLPDYRQAVWPDAGNLAQALTLETQEALGVPRMTAREALGGNDRLLVVWVENPMTTEAELAELSRTLTLGHSTALADVLASDLVHVRLYLVESETEVQ